MERKSIKASAISMTVAKQILQNIIHVHIPAGSSAERAGIAVVKRLTARAAGRIRTKWAVLSAACALACPRKASVKRRMAETVIERSLFLITQHIIGLCDLLEFLLRRGVTCVGIRMIFLRQLPVCLPDGRVIRALVHT